MFWGTHHLRHTEAMPKVVEGNVVVVLVDFVEPFPETHGRYVELLNEIQLDKHHLHQVKNLIVLVVVRVK